MVVHPELYTLSDIACPQCGKVFHPKDKFKKFCSRQCACTWHHNPDERGTGYTRQVTCIVCGARFLRKSKTNVYCSRVCWTVAQLGDGNRRFNGYITQDERGYLRYTNRHVTHSGQYVHQVTWREANPGGVCEMCAGDVDHVHHRDDDKANNELANLAGLCNLCHLKIHHPKGRKFGAAAPVML